MPKSDPKYRRGRRRRMEKFGLGEVSFVDRPAQSPALAGIQKFQGLPELTSKELQEIIKRRGPRNGEDFEAFYRRIILDEPQLPREVVQIMFDDATATVEGLEKRGDMVDMFTASEDGHQHGLSVYVDEDGVFIMVMFAAGPDGEMHDHQIVMNPDGSFSMSENRGHTHDIDEDRLREVVFNKTMNKAASDEQGLSDMIEKFEEDYEEDQHEQVAKFIKVRAEELGMTDKLPEEGTLAGLLKVMEDDTSELMVDKETSMSKTDLEKSQEQNAALQAQVESLTKVAALSAVHKAHYDSLDESLDDDARKAFLDMSDAERDAEVEKATAKAADSDPVVYTAANGDEYRKSDDSRLVKMAKERDEERKETIRIRKAAEDADLTKRAETELANFPGEVDVRKAILKAVDGIADEGTRAEAQKALKAQNAKLAKGFETVGTTAAPVIEKSEDQSEAEAELDTLAKALAEKDGIDFYEAYEKVSDENPQLLAKAIAG